jgi:hypothetical protein
VFGTNGWFHSLPPSVQGTDLPDNTEA